MAPALPRLSERPVLSHWLLDWVTSHTHIHIHTYTLRNITVNRLIILLILLPRLTPLLPCTLVRGSLRSLAALSLFLSHHPPHFSLISSSHNNIVRLLHSSPLFQSTILVSLSLSLSSYTTLSSLSPDTHSSIGSPSSTSDQLIDRLID